MVQYITYKKKKYPIKLGQYSLRRFEEEQNAKLADLETNIRLYEPLLFYCLKQGARYENQSLDLEMEDMPDVLDECMVDFSIAFSKFFETDIPEDIRQQMEKLAEGGGQQTGTGSRAKR